ncbi:MAG: hypothetical protein J6T10_02605 [Methanobrevibacter sp.]|nr:hypothetical protein [Methanobrevibacter sp.]
MIRVKRSRCELIGSSITVLSELTVALINCAEVLSKESNLTIEESIRVICNTAIEANRRMEENE